MTALRGDLVLRLCSDNKKGEIVPFCFVNAAKVIYV
jgi:hypothetical protein